MSLKYVCDDLFDNKSALILVIAWQQMGDKPLAGPVINQVYWLMYV